MSPRKPRKKQQKAHYVNNKEFVAALVDYVEKLNAAKEAGEPAPVVPDYIAKCFLNIAEGLSHAANFVRYTYREEMVMDGVENCLRAVNNYNIDASTRKGTPNAFGYFTQICWWAFVRRITKENKQQEIKLNYLAESGLEEFMVDPDEDPEVAKVVQSFVDNLRRRIDDVKERDEKVKTYKKKLSNKRAVPSLDSDLTDFFED